MAAIAPKTVYKPTEGLQDGQYSEEVNGLLAVGYPHPVVATA
jgi:hypothetical protein